MSQWDRFDFVALRRRCAAPRLDECALPATARGYQVLLGPTFHAPVALSLFDFGDHADVSAHAATSDERRTWRESKTIVQAPLAAFQKAMAVLAKHPVVEEDVDRNNRDGLLIEASWTIAGSIVCVRGWSPPKGAPLARFCDALLTVAELALQFDETRAALAPLRSYL